jgi:putative chitinase
VKHIKLAIVVVALLALLGAQTAWAAPPASAGMVHTVRPGDTMYSIARMYGTTVAAISAANHIANPNLIYVGQKLVIAYGNYPPPPPPGPRPGQTVYIVRPGDTLSGIARAFGTTVWAISAANGIKNPNCIYVGQRLVIPTGGGGGCYPPCGGGTYYRVQRGDTMYSIACRYHTTVWAISKANGISNPNVIYVGQVLRIP